MCRGAFLYSPDGQHVCACVAQDYGWVEGARTRHGSDVETLPPRTRKSRRTADMEPLVQDETVQPALFEQNLQPVQHGPQPLAAPATASKPDLLRALSAKKQEGLEAILTACEVCVRVPAAWNECVEHGSAGGLCAVELTCLTPAAFTQGEQPSPAQAAMALRTAARAAQRLSSPMRIMQARYASSFLTCAGGKRAFLTMACSQARDRRVVKLVEALSLVANASALPAGLDSRSCAAAIWALSVFGGPVLYETEMDALLKVHLLMSDLAM